MINGINECHDVKAHEQMKNDWENEENDGKKNREDEDVESD